ncbi:MAG: hypothetical protein A2133_00100 [Actinobacteria bacterium RBG_16_64_13]|nr:MAG: hypothetical protein A2133_00100 [Actinobacteria bacterium RBG_16_64_13]
MSLDQLFDGWSAAVAPYALGLVAAALLCASLAAMGWRRRTKPGGLQFGAMMTAATIWAFLYALELTAPSLAGKVVWAKGEYLGIVALPLTWFLFARSHTGGPRRWGRWPMVLVGLIPAVTVVLAATNEFHGLLWSEGSLSSSGSFPALALEYGPWFWVHMVYSYALLALGSFLLLRAVYRYPQIYRQQAVMLMIATLAPWVGNILFLSGVVPAGNIDLTPFAFTITGVALALSMSRFRLFSLLPALLPTARNRVLQTMRDGVLVLDVDGRVASVNPAASSILCEQAADLIGKEVSEILGESVAERLVRDQGFDSQFEIRLGEAPSESSYDVVSSPLGLGGGIGVGRLLVLRDITARAQADEALRESEERYRALFELESDAIVLVDNESGQILEVNAAAMVLYGYSREEWLSMNHTDVSVEPDKTRQAAGDRLTQIPIRRHKKKDGTVFPVEITGRHFDWKGRSVRIAAIRDITDRVEAEQALRERDDKLRQAQKMEAVGQLAGGIAHDFNNLLTAIIGYSDLILASSERVGDSLRADVEEIKAAADRARALTRQILAFSRHQALQPEVVSLNDLVTSTDRLLCRTLGEDIELVTLLCPELELVEVDASQFEQVLMNLALNSRDAMPHGGKLTIETANVELSDEYCDSHLGITPGHYVMLAVSDTGAGMDEKTRSRVFEPFFTTKEPGRGTGLGLSTVYGTVKQSGGSVFVYSEPGKGTTFKIYLRRVDGPIKSRPTTAAGSGLTGGQETILVVEDERGVRQLVVRILKGLGYDVIDTANGDDALGVLKDRKCLVDMLLTDVVLPGTMQGNELAQAVGLLYPRLPVLYMSGYTRDAIVHAGRLDQGVNYLEKPFTPDGLAKRVREVLDCQAAAQ